MNFRFHEKCTLAGHFEMWERFLEVKLPYEPGCPFVGRLFGRSVIISSLASYAIIKALVLIRHRLFETFNFQSKIKRLLQMLESFLNFATNFVFKVSA